MSSTDIKPNRKVILQSNDDRQFEVDYKVACMSETVKTMFNDVLLTDDSATLPVPLPNVSGPILEKVIKYCEHHKGDEPIPQEDDDNKEKQTDDIDAWDQDFVGGDQGTLFELILAANFLDIKPLLDLTCKTVANMIKGKTPEEIRKTFNIKNDFAPGEEDQIRKENEWCEER